MTGKFIVEHRRNGRLIERVECENKITTDGINAIIELHRSDLPTHYWVYGPDDLLVLQLPLPGVDFERSCGLNECDQCGKLYYDHPLAGPAGCDGRPYLHQLCDGRFVKL